MQITREDLSPTKVKLTVASDPGFGDALKLLIVQKLGREVKVPGFRAGKAPEAMLEKQLDQSELQNEFLETALNELYIEAITEEGLRPVQQPEVTITKFVPYDTIEATIEVAVLGEITLPAYSKINVTRPAVSVTDADVTAVLDNLRTRAATKSDVKRAAKKDDQVIIDFEGTDAKTKEPITGASGKDYPLELGSGSFIPGFEDELIGLKAGQSKNFILTFPKTYGIAELQNRKVNFAVTVNTVQEVAKTKLDAAFAASIGPFKSVAELKADIKKQLQAERKQEAEQQYDNALLQAIAEQTKVIIPEPLIEAELDRIEDEEKRNLVYRGQTWEEHLTAENISEEQHRAKNKDGATLRVKAGLVLAEISRLENISATKDELEMRLRLLKGQYTDEKMLEELDKPENRRDLANRIMTEKTLERIKVLVAKK